jgi:uncharacterized protein YdhG (YjbR/CyaY superfamily)
MAMPKTKFRSIDDYIAAQPEAVHDTLQRLRGIVHKAVPDAEEVISYGIPAFKLSGYMLIYFAAWKQHYSLYPATGLDGPLLDDLAPYKASKGTLRFSFSKPVPVRLIGRFAKFRAAQATVRKSAKSAPKKKR